MGFRLSGVGVQPFALGVSSGLVAMLSLVLHKIWFWIASYYEFYILRVMGFTGIS